MTSFLCLWKIQKLYGRPAIISIVLTFRNKRLIKVPSFTVCIECNTLRKSFVYFILEFTHAYIFDMLLYLNVNLYISIFIFIYMYMVTKYINWEHTHCPVQYVENATYSLHLSSIEEVLWYPPLIGNVPVPFFIPETHFIDVTSPTSRLLIQQIVHLTINKATKLRIIGPLWGFPSQRARNTERFHPR